MIFVTSDLHFGHKNIIKYENRPYENIEQMDEDLIQRWNNTVGKEDTTYVLGDFSWYKGEKTNEILKRLNGKKVLIIGNHDCNFLKDKKFDKSLFEEIEYYKELKYNKKIYVLFHYPIAEHNGKTNGVIHLYGHIHSMNLELERKLMPLAYNVGVDRNGYVPINITKYENAKKE